MTATIITETPSSKSNFQKITSELIYYWMTAFNIPKECEKWHVARLLMLIRVCSEENKPKKKMNKNELANRYRQINEANKKRFNTKG